MSKRESAAAKALVKSMGDKPSRMVPGSLSVQGRSVDWTESCDNKGTCLHARYGNASMDALDAYFGALDPEATQ